MQQKARPLKPVLAHFNNGIAHLCLKIKQQLTLLEQIKSALPRELAVHALHCVINNKKLLVYTDSAVWASQLRFHEKAIQSAIKSLHPETGLSLQVKILDNPATSSSKTNRRSIIPSIAVAHEILNQSLTIKDPLLKQSLEQLSKTLVRLQTK